MLSFELGGVPQRQLIGNSSDNLNWQVTHKAGKFSSAVARLGTRHSMRPVFCIGAKLWLDVVDSQGSSGGIGPVTYNVVGTSPLSCELRPQLIVTPQLRKMRHVFLPPQVKISP
jgi:hypothetical protein